jgi:hypothetical protein
MKVSDDKKYKLFSLLSIFIIGLINLSIPLYGDQAFFLVGAKEMNEGLVLYRDFWDIKQPGIFIFYLFAGKLFGFTEMGIHLFELFYWLLFSIILLWYLEKFRFFSNKNLNYFVPIMIVGTYYSFVQLKAMTQLEVLVNFPLMMVVISNTLFQQGKRRRLLWLLVSGIFGGIVIFFKLILAPVLLALWLFPFIRELKTKNFFSVVFSFLLLPAGMLLAWIPFLIYAGKHDILQLCYTTFFQFPPQVIQYAQAKPWTYLLNSSYNFFSKLSLILPFTLFSIIIIRSRKLIPEMWTWLVIGIVVIMMQRTSWYAYHFLLLYTPIIILALLSIDYLLESKIPAFLHIRKKVFLVTIFVFINIFSVFFLGRKVLELSRYNFALTKEDRLNFAFTNKDNNLAYRIASYLKDEKGNCPIFVVNDPLVYYYTGRNQAVAQSGWSMQLFIPGQINILRDEIIKNKPCFIFIRKEYNPYFETKGFEIQNWINTNYVIFNLGDEGTWYKLNGK